MSKNARRRRGSPPDRNTYMVIRSDELGIYTVQVDHLSHDQISSFVEFLELVYGSRVRIAQINQSDIHRLDIDHMSISEVGLRVASRLYSVPIEGIRHRN